MRAAIITSCLISGSAVLTAASCSTKSEPEFSGTATSDTSATTSTSASATSAASTSGAGGAMGSGGGLGIAASSQEASSATSGAGGQATGAGGMGAGGMGGTGGGTPSIAVTCGNKTFEFTTSEMVMAKPKKGTRVALAADTPHLAWLDSKSADQKNSELWYFDQTALVPPMTPLLSDLVNPSSLRFGSSTIYFAEIGHWPLQGQFVNGKVQTVPTSGTPVNEISNKQDVGSNIELSFHFPSYYWLDLKYYPILTGYNPTTKALSDVYKFAIGVNPTQLAVNYAYFYYGHPKGVTSIDKSTSKEATVDTLSSPPLDLATDGDSVFWVSDVGKVKGVEVTNNSKTTFELTDKEGPTALAVDDNLLFWLNQKSVRAACKQDASKTVTVADAAFPLAIVQDKAAVYWIDGDGAIWRSTRKK
jgi:hypothetical protein